MKSIDFYFDFISPYTYLAATQMERFCVDHPVDMVWIPVNLPKLIHESGNVPPGNIKNKALYSLRDLKRWAEYLNVPFKMIRPGSFDSRPALGIAASLEGEDRVKFCMAVFTALWSGSVDSQQEDWLDEVFRQQSLPQSWRLLRHDVLTENTQQALKAGAFGVPTFVLKGEGRPQLFFGLDHLDFLARACDKIA